jgi:predicted NUDIX family phosphoesterase
LIFFKSTNRKITLSGITGKDYISVGDIHKFMLNPEAKEKVLAVRRDILDAVCPKTFCYDHILAKSTVLDNFKLIDRDIAEQDHRYKQVIPYVVIRHQKCFLLIQRTSKQDEKRLHNMYSLGVGGHVNVEDTLDIELDAITKGMRRELNEEIRLEEDGMCELIGIINDDSTEVAQLHVGFIYLMTTPSSLYTILEPGKYIANWKTSEELSNYYEHMESWAQIVHDYLLFPEKTHLKQKWEVIK